MSTFQKISATGRHSEFGKAQTRLRPQLTAQPNVGLREELVERRSHFNKPELRSKKRAEKIEPNW